MKIILSSLQTFAIPGSIFLSILSGFLYPFPLAISIVCVVRSVYQISKCVSINNQTNTHTNLTHLSVPR